MSRSVDVSLQGVKRFPGDVVPGSAQQQPVHTSMRRGAMLAHASRRFITERGQLHSLVRSIRLLCAITCLCRKCIFEPRRTCSDPDCCSVYFCLLNVSEGWDPEDITTLPRRFLSFLRADLIRYGTFCRSGQERLDDVL